MFSHLHARLLISLMLGQFCTQKFMGLITKMLETRPTHTRSQTFSNWSTFHEYVIIWMWIQIFRMHIWCTSGGKKTSIRSINEMMLWKFIRLKWISCCISHNNCIMLPISHSRQRYHDSVCKQNHTFTCLSHYDVRWFNHLNLCILHFQSVYSSHILLHFHLQWKFSSKAGGFFSFLHDRFNIYEIFTYRSI